MPDLLTRISSYNLFNYLFPGVVFVAIARRMTPYSFAEPDLLRAAFVYYFIGLVISRVGSLVIEPLFSRLGMIHPCGHDAFAAACKLNPKIEVLSEANNTFRTLCATFLMLLMLRGYEWLGTLAPQLRAWRYVLAAVAFVVLFALSYRKQTDYVVKSVGEASTGGLVRP